MNDKKIINTGQYVTLEHGNEYCVVSSTIYDDDNYVFLINPTNVEEQYYSLVLNEDGDIKINVIDKDASDNEALIEILSDVFKNDMKKYLSDMGVDV